MLGLKLLRIRVDDGRRGRCSRQRYRLVVPERESSLLNRHGRNFRWRNLRAMGYGGANGWVMVRETGGGFEVSEVWVAA